MGELLPTTTDPVAEAEAAVRSYARWHICPSKPDAYTFRCEGGQAIVLPTLHLTDVASVVIGGVPITDFDWYANGVLWRSWWPEGVCQVTFTHGYDQGDIGDLYNVIEALAARGVNPGPYTRVGMVMIATDPKSGAPLGGALSAAEMAVVDRYRLVPRP